MEGERRQRVEADRRRHQLDIVEYEHVLGAFCLVTVTLAAAPVQSIVVNLSRHSVDRMSLAIGAPLSTNTAAPPGSSATR